MIYHTLFTTHLLLSSAPMHSLDFVGQRGCTERVSVFCSFVDVAEGHLLGKLALAFRHKLAMCFSAMEEGHNSQGDISSRPQPIDLLLGKRLRMAAVADRVLHDIKQDPDQGTMLSLLSVHKPINRLLSTETKSVARSPWMPDIYLIVLACTRDFFDSR